MMKMPMISERDKDAIARILAPYAEKIDRVSVFGSRATGAAKPASDIDLVIYGNLDEKVERRLWTLFQESNIPVTVDVVVYSNLEYAPLKAHIDRASLVLFERDALKMRAAVLQPH